MRRTRAVNVFTVVAGAVLAAAFLVGLIAFAGFFRLKSSYNVSAYVYNARGIAKYSTVFEAGLPAGIVTGVNRNGPDAILTLRIDRGVRPLPVNSTLRVGTRSLLGESDVELYPGTSKQMVRNGGSLGLSQDLSYTEVDQILNSLAPPTEPRVRQFIQGLGGSVAGQGQNLNNTVGGFAALVNDSQPMTSILSHQRSQVADIVQYFGDVMGAIAQRTQALQQFARGALSTFQNLAQRDVQLKAMFAEFPYAIDSVATVGHALATTEPYITYTLDHLSKVVHDLAPTVPLIAPGAQNASKIVGSLGHAAPQLRSLLANLKQTEPSATAALPAVHALSCQVNPMIRFLEPYGPDISAFFENFGAADNFYSSSAGGHALPGVLQVDPKALFRGVFGQPANAAMRTLVNMGFLHLTGAQPTWYHSLRPPGQRNSLSYGAGDSTPAQFGATHKFPRLYADCSR